MSVSTPSQGTHFSDGLRTGPIIGSTFIPGANVLTPSVMVSSPTDQLPPGIFNTPMSLLDVIPAPVSATSIAADQLPASAGYLTLAAINGIGITVITYSGIPNVLQLDCARNITITGTGGTTAATFTVFGWDQYGIPLVEQIAGPVGATLVRGSKAFLYIQAINVSATTTANVSVGVGNTFGLPYLIASQNYAFVPYWNGYPDVVVLAPVLSNNNPITTVNDSSIVTVVADPLDTASLVAGEWITISGATGPINGITAAELNITAQIISLTATTFTYMANGTATGNGSGGGNAVVVNLSNNVVTGDQRVATITTRDVRGTYTPSSDADGFNRLTINFYNASGDGRNFNNASNGIINLNLNPFTVVNGINLVSVLAPNHQLTEGENVTIAGAIDTHGIVAASLNITAPVSIVDQNNFTYVATASATSSGQGGGSVVTMTPRYGNLYQVAAGRFGVPQYSRPLI